MPLRVLKHLFLMLAVLAITVALNACNDSERPEATDSRATLTPTLTGELHATATATPAMTRTAVRPTPTPKSASPLIATPMPTATATATPILTPTATPTPMPTVVSMPTQALPASSPTPEPTSRTRYAEEWQSFSNVSELERNRPELALAATSLPWIEDGIDETERVAVQELIDIAVLYEKDSTLDLINKPWIEDGIDHLEVQVIRQIRVFGERQKDGGALIIRMPFLATIGGDDIETLSILIGLADWNENLLRAVLEKRWVEDGLQGHEVAMLSVIGELSDGGGKEALLIINMPFLDTVGEVSLDTVAVLAELSASQGELFYALASKPWVEDGFNRTETLLVQLLEDLADRREASAAWITMVASGSSPTFLEEHSIGSQYDVNNSGDIEHSEALRAAANHLEEELSMEDAMEIVALYGFSDSLIPAPSLVELARASGWHRQGVEEGYESRVIKALDEIDRRIPELAKIMSLWPWIFDEDMIAAESLLVELILDLADEDKELLWHIVEIPWLSDGFTEWEKFVVLDLWFLYNFKDQEAATVLWSLPWVVDDIIDREAGGIGTIREIVSEHSDLAKELLDFGWLHDDLSAAEEIALLSIRDMARNDPQLARKVVKEPFMEPPFLQRDEYALQALSFWSSPGFDHGSTMLAQLANQPWYNDGLDDLEAALLHTIAYTREDFGQALIETHYVASASASLPLSGDVGIAVVRHTPFPPGDITLETLEEGVRIIEEFVGAHLPVSDVILLLVEPEFWDLPSRGQLHQVVSGPGNKPDVYTTAIMQVGIVASAAPVTTLYHEIGHYYISGGHKWLVEGSANFLEAYVIAATGGRKLEERLAYLESSNNCDKENIWQHVNDYEADLCSYELGEKFFLAMYEALGPEVVAAAMRDLLPEALFIAGLDEDQIYNAFLSNAPPEKEEAFMAAYRRYHGGPIVDRSLPKAADFLALSALYAATNGDNWSFKENWIGNVPLGAWRGVETNREGSVVGIRLFGNALAGEIPPELGDLSSLVELLLSENQLRGEIVPELGNLTNLEVLDLGNNQLSGEIPAELGKLDGLNFLSLGQNQLSGQIPPELGNLTDLDTLWLGYNRLTGEIPAELGNLANLASLHLISNQLSGEIPASLGNLANLHGLHLWHNEISGEIPPELGKLNNLHVLNLGINQLSGEIPKELGSLTNLETLWLHQNQLNGAIPKELGSLTNLQDLHLLENRLSGTIPKALGSLTNLQMLNLAGNRLSGTIPAELGNLANLKWMNLAANQLSGEIPIEMGNLTNLVILRLHRNSLSGEIPSELGNLTNLETLTLGDNQFTGCIPEGLRSIPDNDFNRLGLPFCGAP